MREKKGSSSNNTTSIFFWRLSSFLLVAWLGLTLYSWYVLTNNAHSRLGPPAAAITTVMTSVINTDNDRSSEKSISTETHSIPAVKSALPSLDELASHAKDRIAWRTCNTDITCMTQLIPQQKDNAVYSTSHSRLLHVLCPYPSNSEQATDTQKLTMASIATAQHYWKHYGSHKKDMDIDIVTLEQWQHREERVSIPSTFFRSPYWLQLTAQDFLPKDSTLSKPLPILREILEIAYLLASRGDYTHVILSNMDIAVMPFFYEDVFAMLACTSAFFINRVEIPVAEVKDPSSFHLQHATASLYRQPPAPLTALNNLQLAYEYTLSFRQLHPGYDCMVLDTMALLDVSKSVGNVFTGYPPVGSVLTRAVNDMTRARSSKSCKVVTHLHSTFHIGSRNSDWGDMTAKAIIDRNGELVSSKNFSSSYLPSGPKPALRKEEAHLGIMKCPIAQYSDRNNRCFWRNPYFETHRKQLDRYWFFEDRTHH